MQHLQPRIFIAVLLTLLCSTSELSASDQLKVPTLAPILREVAPSVVALSIKRRPTEDEVLLSGEPDNEDRQVQVAASGVVFDGERG